MTATIDVVEAPDGRLPVCEGGWGVWDRVPLPGPWRALRACRDEPVGTFLPARGDMEGHGRAVGFCARCPVTAECLAYALRYPSIVGVFGGTSYGERQVMRRPTARSA